MRAGGRWIDLERGFTLQSQPKDGAAFCSCVSCAKRRRLQAIVDDEELVALAAYLTAS